MLRSYGEAGYPEYKPEKLRGTINQSVIVDSARVPQVDDSEVQDRA